MEILSRRHSELINGVEVRGSPAFRVRTREALELLRESALFGAARDHVAVIRQGRRSGMKAWAAKPTFTVGAATWRHSAVWYAGAIAHDAYHAKLYCDAKSGKRGKQPDNDAWTGAELSESGFLFSTILPRMTELMNRSASDSHCGMLRTCAIAQLRNRYPAHGEAKRHS